MKKRNPEDEDLFTVESDVDTASDPTEFPDWYKQLFDLSLEKRERVAKAALERIKQAKPDTYEFIRKFKCELVGISPRVEYVLLKKGQGDTDVTYIHPYSMPTLLFWCPAGEFHFSVNAVLKYNDTVLNKVDGNNIDREIQGFTG